MASRLVKSLSFRNKKSAYAVAQERKKEEDAKEISIVSVVEKKTPKRKSAQKEQQNGQAINVRPTPKQIGRKANGNDSAGRKKRAHSSEKRAKPEKTPRLSVASEDSLPSVAPEDEIIENGESVDSERPSFLDESLLISQLINTEHSAPPGLLMYHSEEEAKDHFSWLICPMQSDAFFKDVWERTVIHVGRNNPSYYGQLFSTAQLEKIIDTHPVEWGSNLNAARYVNEVRETLSPEGRVCRSEAWDLYLNEGCSLQLINPQSFSPSIAKLCARLHELFGSFVGANTYLTPSGTQGFAPHWDDIDAFVLQLEGTKHWTVYQPKDGRDYWPRESSPNFNSSDVSDLQVVFDGWIESGDLLYVPRGFVHQGYTSDDQHSLHVTISACRQNTYADMLEKLVPEVLASVVNSEMDLRRSLPIGYLSSFGVATQQTNKSEQRKVMTARLKQFLSKFGDKMMEFMDSGADMMANEFVKTSMPPFLTETEKSQSISGVGYKWNSDKSQPLRGNDLTLKSRVKFIRKHAQRLIYDSEGASCLIHRMHNSLVSEQNDSTPVDLLPQHVSGVEFLLQTYPEYVPISDIDAENNDEKLELANMLFENGLLMTECEEVN